MKETTENSFTVRSTDKNSLANITRYEIRTKEMETLIIQNILFRNRF